MDRSAPRWVLDREPQAPEPHLWLTCPDPTRPPQQDTPGGRGLLARIDTGTNQVGRPIPLRHAPTGLTVTPDGRTVWLATGSDRVLHQVDASAGQVDRKIKLPVAPGQVAFGDGAVWATTTTGNAVLRINAARRAITRIPVGNGPTGIAFGADQVWVANGQDGTVSMIDPQTNDVLTLHLGFRPVAVAVDQRAVWVALAV